MLGGERIHYVADVDAFYEALGYTDEVKYGGLLPDEFIWTEYRKPESEKSPSCLQSRIIEYLQRSALAAELLAGRVGEWEGGCSDFPAKKNGNCSGCLLCPENKS